LGTVQKKGEGLIKPARMKEWKRGLTKRDQKNKSRKVIRGLREPDRGWKRGGRRKIWGKKKSRLEKKTRGKVYEEKTPKNFKMDTLARKRGAISQRRPRHWELGKKVGEQGDAEEAGKKREVQETPKNQKTAQ